MSINEFRLNYDLSYNKILTITDIDLKKAALEFYKSIVQELDKNIDFHPDLSLQELINESQKIYYKNLEESYNNTSELFWPGHTIYLYPSFKLVKSTKRRLCSFCSQIINPKDKYYIYRPILDDKTTKKTYILNSNITAREFCDHPLPTNIKDLEILQLGMDNSYDNPYYSNNGCNDISFEEMSINLGGSFKFIELTKNPKVRILQKKE